MAFRNIMVETPAHISCRRNQLVVHTDADHMIAIEDISALLIENRQTTITAAALSELGQSGCVVFICDEKHLPAAVLTPFADHSRELSVIRTQLEFYHTKNCQGTTTSLAGMMVGTNYTIPRTARELQLLLLCGHGRVYYTIPRTARELQPLPG